MNNLNLETKKEVDKGIKWETFVKGENWQRAKRILLSKLADLDSVSVLREKAKGDTNKLLLDIEAKSEAINLILEWIGDIEGKAEQSETNREIMNRNRKEEIIREF